MLAMLSRRKGLSRGDDGVGKGTKKAGPMSEESDANPETSK